MQPAGCTWPTVCRPDVGWSRRRWPTGRRTEGGRHRRPSDRVERRACASDVVGSRVSTGAALSRVLVRGRVGRPRLHRHLAQPEPDALPADQRRGPQGEQRPADQGRQHRPGADRPAPAGQGGDERGLPALPQRDRHRELRRPGPGCASGRCHPSAGTARRRRPSRRCPGRRRRVAAGTRAGRRRCCAPRRSPRSRLRCAFTGRGPREAVEDRQRVEHVPGHPRAGQQHDPIGRQAVLGQHGPGVVGDGSRPDRPGGRGTRTGRTAAAAGAAPGGRRRRPASSRSSSEKVRVDGAGSVAVPAVAGGREIDRRPQRPDDRVEPAAADRPPERRPGPSAVTRSPTDTERFRRPHAGGAAVLVEAPALPGPGECGPAVVEQVQLALRRHRPPGVGGVRVRSSPQCTVAGSTAPSAFRVTT